MSSCDTKILDAMVRELLPSQQQRVNFLKVAEGDPDTLQRYRSILVRVGLPELPIDEWDIIKRIRRRYQDAASPKE